MGLALDAPSERDEVLHEEPGLTIVISKQDLKRTGTLRIDWLGGDPLKGFPAVRRDWTR